MQSSIHTLINLLTFFTQQNPQDSKIKIYDMGRRIQSISLNDFNNFELTKIAWPYPLMRSAWFALCFELDKNPDNITLWFLKFPLDEQGKLIQASRDDYIAQFLNKIEQKLSFPEILQSTQEESPYGFKPSEEKLANIHAIISTEYHLKPSQYFIAVKDYLQQAEHFENWQQLGYQGIADYCALIPHQPDLENTFLSSINDLPKPVLNAFSHCLEHHRLNDVFFNQFNQYYQVRSNVEVMLACLHCLSHENLTPQQGKILDSLIHRALNSDYKSHIELLAVIAGRCWSRLKNDQLIQMFIKALAKNNTDQNAFNILISDILFIPGMKNFVLNAFRDANRSEVVSKAIGDFYESVSVSS